MVTEKWEENSSGLLHDADHSALKTLIGRITSLTKAAGYINQTTFFSMNDVCDGNVFIVV